ncbi:hypothetical protein BJ912DRAFT_1041032 [Pholiota molesta]|nr:hypothetical protein BJ912DRAFT_1041032 [Pholiota molesta]
MTKEGEERARGDPGVGDPQGTPPYAFRPRSPLTTTAPHSLHARQRGATARPPLDTRPPATSCHVTRPRHCATSPARDIVPRRSHTMTTAPHCLPRRPAAHDTMTTKAPPLPRHRAAAHAHDDNGHPTPAMSSRPAPRSLCTWRATSPTRDIMPWCPHTMTYCPLCRPATPTTDAHHPYTPTTAPHCLPRRPAAHDMMTTAPHRFTTSSCGARHDDDGSAPTPLPSTVCAYNGAAHKAAPAAQRRIKGGFLTPFVAPIAGTLRVPTGIREQTGLPSGTCDPQVNDPRIRVIRGNKSLRVRVWLLAVEIPAGKDPGNLWVHPCSALVTSLYAVNALNSLIFAIIDMLLK